MAKGTSIERMSRFIRDAHDVGISVRMSAILGYPGETAADIEMTTPYLEEHAPFIDRIRLGLFKAIPGTLFHDRYVETRRAIRAFASCAGITVLRALSTSTSPPAIALTEEQRRATFKLAHRINSRPLRDEARDVFEGLM